MVDKYSSKKLKPEAGAEMVEYAVGIFGLIVAFVLFALVFGQLTTEHMDNLSEEVTNSGPCSDELEGLIAAQSNSALGNECF